ncbi:hypothetical protein [Hydrogenovibrio kuenenii]|uniref:hypothetical protein n=1 Tax=Hydrogenovibrio kuenenii TaxID=63658 RepID=UPI0004AE934B|nr:hypothetical protein [Hydrogenovibrio kuenenii]
MGFLYEAIAMDSRYSRCQQQWQFHFDQCRQAILQAASQCQQKRSILIVGAGSLRDIPLEKLSKEFSSVYLVDLVFLRDARKQASHFQNIHLIEADVTGCLAQVYQGKADCDKDFSWMDGVNDIDCVVSLNLTTQLPLIPVSWMMKKFNMQEKEAGVFGKKMTESHLNWLNAQPGVKCLISDRWITEYDKQGNQVDGFDPAWDVVLPESDLSWNWEVIPSSESAVGTSQVNQVGVSILS